jgi:hypothetical protein
MGIRRYMIKGSCNVGKCNKQSEYYLANSDGTEFENRRICNDHYEGFRDIELVDKKQWKKIK